MLLERLDAAIRGDEDDLEIAACLLQPLVGPRQLRREKLARGTLHRGHLGLSTNVKRGTAHGHYHAWHKHKQRSRQYLAQTYSWGL